MSDVRHPHNGAWYACCLESGIEAALRDWCKQLGKRRPMHEHVASWLRDHYDFARCDLPEAEPTRSALLIAAGVFRVSRLEMGLSVRQCAKRLGVSAGAVTGWERRGVPDTAENRERFRFGGVRKNLTP